MPRPRQAAAERMWKQQTDEGTRRGPATVADMVDVNDPAIGHIMQAAKHLHSLEFDLRDPEIVQRAIDVGRKNYDRDTMLPPMRHESRPRVPGEVVYYVRIGNRVKIGYSANFATRMSSLNPEEVLAYEPGNRSTERDRHVQFGSLRTHGEWFRLEGPLLNHIQQLRTSA